ncbi:hypothetical protein NNC19_09545 [Clostridium sp. SHJSY1]|uniref:YfaP family protein n=1 Tax=Clostridium sp. SHJSY1 TaxID=2942483 RepID=UPI002875E4D5|nr:hypothetical protein [Clostridium sp. SHJSY1]MDS0525920.1 hypothetical protein [Clostridium sp. SHJSY1]
MKEEPTKKDLNHNEDIKIREKEDDYPKFEQIIKDKFNLLVNKDTSLFTTAAENLWEVYINNLPSESQQYYNCSGCRHFIEKYGNLVMVTEEGTIESVLWAEDVPVFFRKSVLELRRAVNESRITGVFISDTEILGTPKAGIWTHLSVKLSEEKINKSRLKNARQVMAEKLEDYGMINRALEEYSLETINQAVELLKTETLYRSDKCLGVAEWFKELHEDILNVKNNKIKENMIWFYIAKAPVGYCHIKSSMIGTLLDYISSGMDFELISRRFAEKMNPSNYMRAQVAPSQGNIEQAERIIEKMGIANSLRRRYAIFEEMPYFIWKNNYIPKENPSKKVGIFSNIKAKAPKVISNMMDLPSTVMTWEKFQRTILETAEKIEVRIDNTDRLMALVTAADPEAENILLWNNTFSWYYHGGIDAEIRRRVENAGGQYENNEIRCSLIWENYTDLDLHCITPSKEHIYYRDKRSKCGGWLDIDMNAGGGHTTTPVENIRWSLGLAREGHYRFVVHNFCERGSGATPFKVELDVNGKVYSYEGKPLENRQEVTVFEFDYVKGEEPNIVNNSSSNLSKTSEWNLANGFITVKGITNSPNLWGDNPVNHSGNHTFFILDECKDLTEGKGRGFFNESLKSELREIRKTLEAYTATTQIEDIENASACGIGFSKDSEWNLILKVTSNNSTRIIKIDRFD